MYFDDESKAEYMCINIVKKRDMIETKKKQKQKKQEMICDYLKSWSSFLKKIYNIYKERKGDIYVYF